MATDLVVGGATGGVGWRLGKNEPETWYRGMSPEELAGVRANKGITVQGGENFVTQDRSYIEGLISAARTRAAAASTTTSCSSRPGPARATR